ncbi:hypothetical protein QTO34_018463 [Cnephaeus nilssonii]|uniref:Uncharacterized protein n=1 Tax=Cnephaeus nilssonii TaxID=3371016 RepID=A0AA40HYV3_CNENI|nr:hypothetical protein QTO34_018463 [Eptesicus nilssonii]
MIIRASRQQQQHQRASARNRRLAQQVEGGPSVLAALTLKQETLKQRLGKRKLQAQLGRPMGPGQGSDRGRGLSLIQRGLPRGGLRGNEPQEPYLGQNLPRGGQALAPQMGLKRGGIQGHGGLGEAAESGVGGRGKIGREEGALEAEDRVDEGEVAGSPCPDQGAAGQPAGCLHVKNKTNKQKKHLDADWVPTRYKQIPNQ